MRGDTTIWQALARARAENVADAGEPPVLLGAGGQTRRAVLKALAAVGTATAMPRHAWAAAPDAPVAIVGGGIAGLTALWTLTQAGIEARLYEARPRLGGRIYTARPKSGPAFETGAQFVNSDHADMRALCKAFGVGLIDRKSTAHRTMILENGREIADARLVSGMRGIAAQLDADAQRLDKDYAGVAAELDRLSFATYLDRYARLLPEPWVRRLLEATARTEYGVEPQQASAIELIFNLPTLEGRRIDVLSRSDERYTIAGGSSALVEAMAARLRLRIVTGRRVARVDPLGTGARLVFADGSSVGAADVIVTTPASVTRRIDFRIALPPLWRRFIAEVGLGQNGKLQSSMATRPWDRPIGRGGELWQTNADALMSQGWDGSVRPGTGNVWTWYLGGDQVTAADAVDAGVLAGRFAAHVDGAVPGMVKATPATARRSDWHRDPNAMGAYVNFRPGQLTRFGSLIWTETGGIASPPLPSAPVHFAGEHLSDAYPGYMNGGAQTGRLAAEAVIAARAPARRFG
ncbi:flavin monoamine oxidase family protein [Sphingomonas aracearum]|uniref:Tryptophan 2-monooxygenase n=1 Tax=Sphingomonas aracearum TaxID=2283317 RepID=A0A369VWA1_9SPHN|nr:NAD(P)/FAD-dependent oxidoreductase [Sphingomonas aracearum]RDE05915.1 amine oxidase [Sphingomonas aracearum]